MMEVFGLVGIIFSLLPLVLAILLIKWLFNIKQNSDEQVRQNKEIISLLRVQERKDIQEK